MCLLKLMKMPEVVVSGNQGKLAILYFHVSFEERYALCFLLLVSLDMHIQVLKWTNAVFTAEDTDIVEVQVEAGVPEDIIPDLALALALILALVPLLAPAPVRQGYYCFPFSL
jgi:hypothetical protein